jgi:hypothetical protein
MDWANVRGRITDCWAEKYGYSSTKEFEENAQKKFSLIETGVMDQPNCRLLLLNVSAFFEAEVVGFKY